MRFFIIIAAVAVSLVSAASAPRAAGAPVALRQATRNQVVRRMSNRGMRKRQSLPSNGVYPTCEGSPASGSEVYSVIDNVQIRRPLPTLIRVTNAETALICTLACTQSATCRSAEWLLTANPEFDQNCSLYNDYSGAESNNDATSTFFGFDCTNIQARFQTPPLICCNYFSA